MLMQVSTSRFGVVDIPEDRVIEFPKGLLGFPNCTRFCLLEPGEDSCFFWLQSLDDAMLAFVVTDPSLFFPDYKVVIREEQMAELRLSSFNEAQVFTIVNKVADTLTGNLQGPLVVNTVTRTGEQIVLGDRKWTTRHEIMKVAGATPKTGVSSVSGSIGGTATQPPLAIPA